MTKKIDPDVLALKHARKALDGCTSRRMINATLSYLIDFYIMHPSNLLPEHLRPQENKRRADYDGIKKH